MQQRLPLLVVGGAAESCDVRVEITPLHEQQITVWMFEATFEPMPQIPVGSCDDDLRFCKRGFECVVLARPDFQHRVFENC